MDVKNVTKPEKMTQVLFDFLTCKLQLDQAKACGLVLKRDNVCSVIDIIIGHQLGNDDRIFAGVARNQYFDFIVEAFNRFIKNETNPIIGAEDELYKNLNVYHNFLYGIDTLDKFRVMGKDIDFTENEIGASSVKLFFTICTIDTLFAFRRMTEAENKNDITLNMKEGLTSSLLKTFDSKTYLEDELEIFEYANLLTFYQLFIEQWEVWQSLFSDLIKDTKEILNG